MSLVDSNTCSIFIVYFRQFEIGNNILVLQVGSFKRTFGLSVDFGCELCFTSNKKRRLVLEVGHTAKNEDNHDFVDGSCGTFIGI